MSTPSDSLILLPRFTTFAGEGTFKSLPVNVRGYDKIDLSIWRGKTPTDTTFLVDIEESLDRETWSVLSSVDPGEDTESTGVVNLKQPWLRAVVSLTNSTNYPSVSCYAVGILVKRRT